VAVSAARFPAALDGALLLRQVVLLPADVSDRDGTLLWCQLYAARYLLLVLLWGDRHYGEELSAELEAAYGIAMEAVSKPACPSGFTLLPHRWVVERTQPHYRGGPRIDR
jgi:hypothetical protein